MEKVDTTSIEDYQEFKKNKELKKVSADIPFLKNVQLVDVSLKARGPREDSAFARSYYYRKKLRRGVTYLIDSHNQHIELARRGLEKFFDLMHEYLAKFSGATESLKGLSTDDKKLYSAIFEDIETCLKEGYKIVVYKTEKANGENAQISYNERYDAWTISSKNVSILCRNANDIEDYKKMPEQRYSFAILIAQTWFKMISSFSSEVIQLIKDRLKNATIVGEYCGNPKYQHLVEYKEITIYFYALVEKDGLDTCLPVQTAHEFFDKVGLPKVKIYKRGTFANAQDITTLLTELWKEVSSNPIEVDAEGAVIYFECTEGPKPDRVLSLSKLKTLEYRFFRKLREKLKNIIQKLNDPDGTLKKYGKELRELAINYDPPQPMQYYLDIAKLAIDFVYYNLTTARKLGISSRFIDFLNVIKKCHTNSTKPEVKDFQHILDNPLSDDEEEEGGDAENENEEESKGEESKTDSKPEAKNLVIIAPPFYIEDNTKEKICAKFNLSRIEIDFKENEIFDTDRVTILHQFPKLTNVNLATNTYFLITGFTSKRYTIDEAEKTIDTLAKNKQNNNYNAFEMMYLNSKDSKKMLTHLWDKSKAFQKEVIKVAPENYLIVQDFEKPETLINLIEESFKTLASRKSSKKSSNPVKSSEKKASKKICVFIPLGIPGMGKTTFLNSLQKGLDQLNIPMTIVSNDEIRKSIMDDLKKNNPNYTNDQLYEKSNKPTRTKFFDDLADAVTAAKKRSTSSLIFLDKNHPPNIIDDTVAFFRNMKIDYMKIVFVTPNCTSLYKTKHSSYPFSLNLLLTAVTRAVNRKEHLTLGGADTKVAGVVMFFFNFYRNFKASDNELKKFGGDFVMRIPFTVETQETNDAIPEDVEALIKKILKEQRSPNDNIEDVANLLALIEEKKMAFRNPDIEEVYNAVTENLKVCFDL